MLRTSIQLSRCGATSNPRSWQTSVPTPSARCRKPPKMAWTASAATPHFASHFSATPVCGYDPPQPAIARESLDQLLEDARGKKRSGVLVLRGEAGIGKTALLDYLLERSEGCRVARAVGVQSEMELAFAGLQQLCG